MCPTIDFITRGVTDMRKNIKSIFVCTVATVLAFGLITGCGSGEKESDETITVEESETISGEKEDDETTSEKEIKKTTSKAETKPGTETTTQETTVPETTTQKPAFVVTPMSGTMFINGNANVRKGPGTNYESLGKLQWGKELTVLGKCEEWYAVEYYGNTAFVHQSLLQSEEPTTTIPPTTTTQAPTQPQTEASKPVQPETQAPTPAPTQPQTPAPTQPPTQPPTQAPREIPVEFYGLPVLDRELLSMSNYLASVSSATQSFMGGTPTVIKYGISIVKPWKYTTDEMIVDFSGKYISEDRYVQLIMKDTGELEGVNIEQKIREYYRENAR